MSYKYRISKTMNVNARPEIIFKILTEVGKWTLWTKSVKSMTLLNKDIFEQGTKIKIVQPKLLPMTWKVTKMEKDKSFTWVASSFGLRITSKHIIEVKDDTTSVKLITIYEGILAGLIYKMTVKLTNNYMTMEIEGLKEAAEKVHI
ncbi:MAG TPA: SRPBCC family protein [Chitinophagaceae bacterium]|nr:SRPBCC family protein [Chitinophagaceae bacterium]